MRKLVLILMGLIAVSTFIGAYNNHPYPEKGGSSLKSGSEKSPLR